MANTNTAAATEVLRYVNRLNGEAHGYAVDYLAWWTEGGREPKADSYVERSRPDDPLMASPRLRLRANDEHWSVSVERNGENIVTIESNCLSGRDISDKDAETIRNCAQHLLAFIGQRGAL